MGKIGIFVDTNVLLDFFHFRGEDVVQLRKLVGIVRADRARLYVPTSQQMEIQRGRESKICEPWEALKGLKFNAQVPAYCKTYPEYEAFFAAQRGLKEAHSALVAALERDVLTGGLDADHLIAELLAVSTKIHCDDKINAAALRRFRWGNPPGKKKNTIGDELIWEALLSGFSDCDEMHLVSRDGDYSSKLNGGDLKEYLIAEWREAHDVPIRLHAGIAELTREKFPEIKLPSDAEAEAFVGELFASRAYFRTHEAIAKLSRLGEFSVAHADAAFRALRDNGQVNRICSDADVREFYCSLYGAHGLNLAEESRETFRTYYGFGAPGFDPEMDIPF